MDIVFLGAALAFWAAAAALAHGCQRLHDRQVRS